MEWHPCAPVLLAGMADGNVWMWKIPGGDCKTLQGPGCQSTSGKVLPDGETVSPAKSKGQFSTEHSTMICAARLNM